VDITVSFDRGTLVGDGLAGAPSFVWDPRSARYRAPAHAYARLRQWAGERGARLRDEVGPRIARLPSPVHKPELRDYQIDALGAWTALGRRGVVVMPTGAGKTRVALAALATCGVATVILCPTRALVAQWRASLAELYAGPIGVASDGERAVEAITVMTFESAYRHLDDLGARFGLLIVDEVHHFASGSRGEALECAPAPFRLGLTATAPERGSAGGERLEALVGPVVFEVGLSTLTGTHLAPMEHVHLAVALEPDERLAYDASYRPFAEALRAHRRVLPMATWQELLRSLASSPEGRQVLAGYYRAEDLALFPRGKAALVSRLLERHAKDKLLVFVARTKDALAIAVQDLIPLIAAETSAKERGAILDALRAGRLGGLVSARVLNEGIDLPDASVAVLVAGKLGKREVIQRVGRVLRPAEGKRATVYTLVSHGTLEERRFARSFGELADA
jgi:superfamily II DNA or RNA helicase